MMIDAQAVTLGQNCFNNINTDLIIAGKYTKTLDKEELAAHLFEDLDPQLKDRLKGKILVAGANFGCGSSREQAPLALKHGGVAAVVAVSFARIFFRNAINIGLPVVEADAALILDGDMLSIDLGGGTISIPARGLQVDISPLPPVMMKILASGGLVPMLRDNGKLIL